MKIHSLSSSSLSRTAIDKSAWKDVSVVRSLVSENRIMKVPTAVDLSILLIASFLIKPIIDLDKQNINSIVIQI